MAEGFLPPVVAVLLGNITDFTAKMGEAKGEMASVEGSAGKLGAVGKTALLGVAAGAVAIGVESVSMASKFQSTMQLIATQAHAGQQEVDNMSKAVLALAPTVGIGPEKLAEGLYHVESTGLRGQAALDVLKASAQEAAIGMANFDDVTYAMSGVMSVALKDVKNAADGVAYLNTIVGTGDMKMGDLAKAIGTGVLPVFKSAQLGMRDFGSAMSVMTDNSMPAEQAANHLKTAVMLLQNQSGPATKALASIGIKTGELATDLAKPDGFLVAIQDIKKHLEESGKSAVEQGQIIAKAFGGARSAATIEEFVGQLDKLKGKYREMDTVAGRAKQQQEDWAATQQTFKQKMNEVGAQFQVWIIQIGQQLLPILTKMADWFMGSVKWLGDHKGVLVAIASGAIPLLVAGVVLLTVAMWNLVVAFWATGIPELILLFALLGFGIYELVTHLTEVGHFFKWLWDTVWKWTSDRVTDVRNFLVSTFHEVIRWIVDRWSEFIGFWVDLWNTVWKWCSDRVTDIRNFAVNLFNTVVDWIVNRWTDFLNFWKNLWNQVWKWVSDRLTDIRNWVQQRIDDVIAFIHRLGEIPGRVAAWFGQVKDAIVNKFNEAVDWVRGIPGRIGDALGDLGRLLWNAGSAIINGLLNGLKSAWQSVTSFVGGIGNWISAHKGPIEYDRQLLVPHGNAIMDGLHEGLKAGGSRVQSYLDNFTGGIGSIGINGSMSMTGAALSSGQIAGNQPIEINIQMNTRDVQAWLQTGTLRYNLRNSSNGLTVRA